MKKKLFVLFCVTTVMCSFTAQSMIQGDAAAFLELPFAFDDIKSDWQHSAKKIKKFAATCLHRQVKLRRDVPKYRMEDYDIDGSILDRCGLIRPEYILAVLREKGLISDNLTNEKLYINTLNIGGYNNRIIELCENRLSQKNTQEILKRLFVFKYYQQAEHGVVMDRVRLKDPNAQCVSCSDVFQERINIFSKSRLSRMLTDVAWNYHLLSRSKRALVEYAPKIAQTECFILYKDYNNCTRCVEVMHAAQGKMFARHTSFERAPVEAIGRALSAAHQLCAEEDTLGDDPSAIRTQLHGDFFDSNIFIEPNQQVWFIDCESVALSHDNPQPIDRDIVTFIMYGSFLSNEMTNNYGIFNICKRSATFLHAYISLYPPAMQKKLAEYIKTFLARRFNNIAAIIDCFNNNSKRQPKDVCTELTESAFGEKEGVYFFQERAFYTTVCGKIKEHKKLDSLYGYSNFGHFCTLLTTLREACMKQLDSIGC